MQRIVKWTEPYSFPVWHQVYPPGRGFISDLDNGNTTWFDLDPVKLAESEPVLAQAFTRDGVLGRITQHTHSVAGGNRIWTFVVEFD